MSLKTIITTFNSLPENKFNFFLKCVNLDKSIVLNSSYVELSNSDLNLFNELRNKVISLIEEDLEEQTIIKKLINSGLDDEFAQTLIKYCIENLRLIKDAEFISSIPTKQFDQIISSVLKNFFLYHDYQQYFSNYYVDLFKLNNTRELKIILRFLQHHIELVSGRIISPEMLRLKIEKEYNVPKEITDIIYHYIVKYLNEIQNTYLLSRLNSLYSRIDNISDLFESSIESNNDID